MPRVTSFSRILLLSAASTLNACRGSEAPVGEREIVRDTAAAMAGDMAADSSALASADSSLNAAVAARDAARIASFYLENAVLLPAAAPIVEGRAAIQTEWTKATGIPGFSNSARLLALVVSASGDFGVTRGRYSTEMTGPDGKPIVEQGKWVTVWRRDTDGAWRVHTDIYNTDTPPPAHQESTAK